LRDSLVNTLERGYNISGITSALNSVANAASSAANAARDAMNAIQSLNNTPIKDTSSTTSGRVRNDFGAGTQKTMMKYAKGTRNAKGGLSVTDEEGYELKLPRLSSGKYTMVGKGDQIFTAKETSNMFKWAQFDPSKFISNMRSSKSGSDISVTNTTNTNPSFEFNGTLMHIDKVDNSNIKEMEGIANKAVDKLVDKMFKGIKYR
jgi:hypothetical protein